MFDQKKIDENIIDSELLETTVNADQNSEEDITALNDNGTKAKTLEEKIDQALKLLQDNKLSKDEYHNLYEKAFEEAEKLLRADLELAKKFKNLPTEGGFRSDKYKLKGSETEIKTKTKILEVEYGLKYLQAWEIQQIDEELVEYTIQEARKKGKLPTRGLALKILRKKRSDENKTRKMEEKRKSFAAIHSSETIKLEGNKYNIIYANPVYENETSDKQLAVSIVNMKNMQLPIADNAVLFLWTNTKDLIASLEIVKVWGFTYRDHTVWDFVKAKTTGFCFGTRHKILLVATKGDNYPIPKLTKMSVFQERSERTDLKPKYYYETIERMFPKEAYLDVFSAKPFNSKWTTFVNNKEEDKINETN